MIIDIFNHHISRSVGELLEKKGKYLPPAFTIQNSDPEKRLVLMEKYGIDAQALCQTTPILQGVNPEDSAEICAMSNKDNYALCKAYPKNFVNICIISLLDMRMAMKELERSINELDCRGITIASNQNGKGLDSPEYLPFYKKVTEHDLPIFLHPMDWKSYPLVDDETDNWFTMNIFGWPFDTTQGVWRMICGGVLDHFPTLKIVMHHCGGMFPYFAKRAEFWFMGDWKNKLPPGLAKLPRHITEYWDNLYGDTALDGQTSAYSCGYAFFGPDRMMFGTDYPFVSGDSESLIPTNLNGIKAMHIPEKEKGKILGFNAQKLLKLQ